MLCESTSRKGKKSKQTLNARRPENADRVFSPRPLRLHSLLYFTFYCIVSFTLYIFLFPFRLVYLDGKNVALWQLKIPLGDLNGRNEHLSLLSVSRTEEKKRKKKRTRYRWQVFPKHTHIRL
jgi:hypothetical protein